MDFKFTSEQERLRKMVGEFAQNEIAPRAKEIDSTGEFPSDNLSKMAKQGFLGIPFSADYGGRGEGNVGYALAVEEVGKVCASTGFILGVHVMSGYCIHLFGSAQQKKDFLTPLSSGDKLGAFALTEPASGSDASATKTTAILDGSEYVLNGEKCFVTSSGHAETYIVFAATDLGKGPKGVSVFVVSKGTQGFEFGKVEDKIGLRATSNGKLTFKDCRIPTHNLLGREGDGFKIALSGIDRGRIGTAALGVGIAQAALDSSKTYAKQRTQFGQPISSFQAIQFMIADMATEIEAARLLAYRAAWLADVGERFTKQASMAKLYASEVAMRAAVNAVQIHGGYGLLKDVPVERYMRDAKALAIIEGTSEMQRIIISRDELK
jgi:butyryl-CoA dehydrogenase